MSRSSTSTVLVAVTAVAMTTLVLWANLRERREAGPPPPAEALLGAPRAPRTTASGLASRAADARRRLDANPDDVSAAVLYADAALRQGRAAGSGAGLADARARLERVLGRYPDHYDARRMLATLLLSEHRFADAIAEASRARDMRPDDAWVYGVLGDAHVELGQYDEAWRAFQTMMDLRPSSASYARASYARELQGDMAGALDNMRRAAAATTPQDPEAQAWHATGLGELLLRQGEVSQARVAFEQALRTYPDYVLAIAGLARAKAAAGRYEEALALAKPLVARAPSMSVAALAGDLCAATGDGVSAERYYALAEAIGRASPSRDESLALFLAERGRHLQDAVADGERVVRTKQDIFSEAGLAWAYFRIGRLDAALAASDRALRTGTRDKRLLWEAAAIRRAAGRGADAKVLVERALPRHPDFDVLVAGTMRAELPGAASPPLSARR